MNIKRLMEIGCYRGMRHRRNLPVRGQRTQAPTRARARARARARSRRRRRFNLWQRAEARPTPSQPARPRSDKKARRQAQEDVQEARREAHRPPRAGAHPRVVQQHDGDDHRHRRQRGRLVERRRHRLQGIAQGHAVRGDAGGARTPATRPRPSACARSTCASRGRAPAASRRSARCRRSASK